MKNAFLCAAVVILACGFAVGQQYKVLYSFGNHPDDGLFAGSTPVLDKGGNIYGTTMQGGTLDGGTVFEVSNSGGIWNESVLYNFCNQQDTCQNGSDVAGLVPDSAGNIYGMTSYGGVQPCPATGSANGCGVVFELSPSAVPGEPWTYTVLYTFCSAGQSCKDGANPFASLTFDKSGNLYGTTEFGGDQDIGTVFELSSGISGWTETVLYSFCPGGGDFCPDGDGPTSKLTFDKFGNLYGTTGSGGGTDSYGGGVLYELSPRAGGWAETVLYRFPISGPLDPDNLAGPVSIDPEANLYTTLYSPINARNGLIGRVSTKGVVNIFRFDGSDGKGPSTGVLVDVPRRILYGTTSGGPFGPGNIFRLDRFGQASVLYLFCQVSGCADGSRPGGLVEDNLGNLYGTTLYGGNESFCLGSGCGVVFEITP
jgi:uncharacterized repeat protein (TIGR03803 family)